MPSRHRFFVELKDEETTVVSWKKLVADAEGAMEFGMPSEAPAGANPALEARIAPEKNAGPLADKEDPLSQAPNRFSSVIERIERLYKGGDSDDDNAEDSPDEDQYNTDDSFIDDEELNEYFMVENAKTKHSGFFINRGALEKINVPTPVAVAQPKKRKRRELKKDKKEEVEGKRRIKGRIKAAARQFPSQLDPLSGNEVQINREHDALIRIQPSETEELSSGSDAFVQGPGGSSRNYNLGKRDLQGVEKNGGGIEGHLEVNISLNTESVFGEARSVQNRSEYRYGSSADEKKWNEASREPKGVMKVSDSLKMKMMQQSTREDGARDSDGGAGKAAADYSQKSLSPGPKEPSPGRRGWPKGTVMERAIQDLIKIVHLLCPVSAEGEEQEQPSNAGSKTKRLPREVKTRLAKVARLAQAKQGKVPDELIERLHGILGHIMRPNTLKRNLKEMVEHGNLAKQEKEGRLLDIKREVTEMVRNRVTTLQFQGVEAREGSSDDFQGGSLTSKKASTSVEKYKWDHAIEDLLCNLYEQYLEGMDEHKGPQIRKLYVELAELWPEGWMDNNGIKAAVFRAKERKKRLSKLNKEPRKKKADSCDTSRADEDFKDGSVGRLLKYSGSHSLEELLPKRNDDSTPEDDSVFLRASQQAWRPSEKIHKHKQHFGGVVKSSLKASKVEHGERSRQASEELREQQVYEKNPLLKKKRKKLKAGSDGENTTSPLLFGTPIGPKEDLDVSRKALKDPTVHDGPLDDPLLRSR
ncbi:hypothetical protein M758_3G150900 [Ceratodon purpureus]|nr:hypothetical protein M758_3G150900 [Ceratodon purpureus]